jgi:hypothetical protein
MLDATLERPQASMDNDAALSMSMSTSTRELVVPEHSTLARSLRQRGWIVRAGWRSSVTKTADGTHGWMLRLAAPSAGLDS